MNLVQYSHDHLVSAIKSLAKEPEERRLPPAFTFVSGADNGYTTDMTIYRFMMLNQRDMLLVPVLMRLLVVKASVGLKDRWHDVMASCFLPVAYSPASKTGGASVVGAQLLFTPEGTSYRNYCLAQKPASTDQPARIDLAINVEEHSIEDAPESMQRIVMKINPFTLLKYSDNGIAALFGAVEMPDGSQYLTGKNPDMDEDIYALAGGIKNSPLDVTP